MTLVAALEILATALILATVWIITDIIGKWRIFHKAGDSRWKSLIPFYGTYTLYKLTWHRSAFWLYWGIIATNIICSRLFQANVITVLGTFFSLATLGIYIERMHRLAICFHKSVFFTIGLVLFKPIFILILAFDKSAYTYIETDNHLLHELQNNLVVQTEKYKAKLQQTSEAKSDTKKFAQGFCFKKIFIFFILGCLIGTYWEEFLYFVTHNFQTTNHHRRLCRYKDTPHHTPLR